MAAGAVGGVVEEATNAVVDEAVAGTVDGTGGGAVERVLDGAAGVVLNISGTPTSSPFPGRREAFATAGFLWMVDRAVCGRGPNGVFSILTFTSYHPD